MLKNGGGDTLHRMTRKEILHLFPYCRVPEPVREKFLEAGIINGLQTQSGPAQYEWNLASFIAMDDRTLSALYSELNTFYAWYKECERFIQEFPSKADEEDLEAAAVRFTRLFIHQWSRYH